MLCQWFMWTALFWVTLLEVWSTSSCVSSRASIQCVQAARSFLLTSLPSEVLSQRSNAFLWVWNLPLITELKGTWEQFVPVNDQEAYLEISWNESKCKPDAEGTELQSIEEVLEVSSAHFFLKQIITCWECTSNPWCFVLPLWKHSYMLLRTGKSLALNSMCGSKGRCLDCTVVTVEWVSLVAVWRLPDEHRLLLFFFF